MKYNTYRTIAAQRILRALPDPATVRVPAPHRAVAPPPFIQRTTKKAQDNAWWKDLPATTQEAYLKNHPKSRKRREAAEKAAKEAGTPHVTPSDRPLSKIVWPTRMTNDAGAAYEKERLIKNAAQKNKKQDLGYDKGLAFLMRVGKIPLTKEAKEGLSTKEKSAAQKEYREFADTYGKMNPEELSEAGDDYYNKNTDHANADKIKPSKYGTDTDLDDDQVEDAKNDAASSDEAEEPGLLKQESEAFEHNPINDLPKAEQEKKISESIEGIAPNFAAGTNKIIAHAYKFLNKEQINLLDAAAHDAILHNLMQKRKTQLPKARKRLLSIIGVTIAVAAGVAFGGPLVGVLAFNHCIDLTHKEGNFHEVIWNSLRGKKADGSDDPDFDPHEDAVEKIVKSLKRQLLGTDDEDQRDNIEKVIDQLEDSILDNDEAKDYTPNRKKRRKK